MIGILMQKMFTTTTVHNGKHVSALVLMTEGMVCLKKVNKENKYTVFIGYFSILKKNEKRFNTSFLNGNYQLENKKRFVRQFNVTKEIFDQLIEGEEILIDRFFNKGDIVDVTGISIGKGTTGVVKRYGFSKQPKTHGNSKTTNSNGSTGSRKPRRVILGKKMPGHDGNKKVTIPGITIIQSHTNKLILLGLIPGHYGAIVLIRPNMRNK